MNWTVNGKEVPPEIIKSMFKGNVYRVEVEGTTIHLTDVGRAQFALFLTAVGVGMLLGFFLSLGVTRAFGI